MKIKNIIDLRNTLIESLEHVQKDPRRLSQSSEIANHCGKIIAATKIRIDQHLMVGEVLMDDFLGPTSGIPLLKYRTKTLPEAKK